jgi:RNA polymerase sigma factor (sigma-70 family)
MQARLDKKESDTNATILGAACAGDAFAWEELVRRYHGAVRAAVGSYRLRPADTADAVQNTWLRLLERGATIRNPEMLGGWLTTTARRECLALIRRQQAECPRATIDTGQPAADPTPEAAVITSEARRHVRSATNTLSDRQRTLIDALYYHPVGSYADVGRHTGMPIGSVGPTHLRAIRCLRHRLSDLRPEGWTDRLPDHQRDQR